MSVKSYVAVHLGLSVGRAVIGEVRRGRLRLQMVRRFANRPIAMPCGHYLDVVRTYKQVVDALEYAQRQVGRRIDGIAVDAVLMRHGLINRDGSPLTLPRNDLSDESALARRAVHERYSPRILYELAGVPPEAAVTPTKSPASDPP